MNLLLSCSKYIKQEAVFQQLSRQDVLRWTSEVFAQATDDHSNVGGYSFAAYTYVSSRHICLLQFIDLLRKNKTEKKKQ